MIKVTIGLNNYTGAACGIQFKSSVGYTHQTPDSLMLLRLKTIWPETKFVGIDEKDVPKEDLPEVVTVQPPVIPPVGDPSAPTPEAEPVESESDDESDEDDLEGLPDVEIKGESEDDDLKGLPEVEVNNTKPVERRARRKKAS